MRFVARSLGSLVVISPATVQAECLGEGCYDGLGTLIVGGLVGLAVGLAILGFAVFKAWKRFGPFAALGVLAAVVVVGYGAFPLVL